MLIRTHAATARRRGPIAWTPLVFSLGLGCSEGTAEHAAGPSADAGDDPAPMFSAADRAALAALSLDAVPPPPPDVTNAHADDSAAALFGRRLFFTKVFAGKLLDNDNDGSEQALGRPGDTGRVACADCHVAESFFSDSRSLGHQTSLAAGWGLRRAPSVLDVSRSKIIMWDGRRDSLFSQVFGPIESSVEMNSSRLYAAEQVFQNFRSEYESVFGPMPPLDDGARFPALTADSTGCVRLGGDNKCVAAQHGAPGDGAEFDGMTADDQTAVTRVIVNVGKAVGAYERLLTCGTTRFDRWAKGDESALTRSEQRGAAIFVGKGKCASCHSGPFLSDEKFHNVGLKAAVVATVFLDANDEGAKIGIATLIGDPLNAKGVFSDGDDGRTPAAVTSEMEGAFRTPRLRCVSKRPSFMHTAQFRTLDEVVAFFARGGDIGGFPGHNEITAFDLGPRERADVVAFLGALDGDGPPPDLLVPPP